MPLSSFVCSLPLAAIAHAVSDFDRDSAGHRCSNRAEKRGNPRTEHRVSDQPVHFETPRSRLINAAPWLKIINNVTRVADGNFVLRSFRLRRPVSVLRAKVLRHSFSFEHSSVFVIDEAILLNCTLLRPYIWKMKFLSAFQFSNFGS